MERKTQTPQLIVLGLIALTWLSVALFGVVSSAIVEAVTRDLPARAGAYQATAILYCQNSLCDQLVEVAPGTTTGLCSKCGSPLGMMSDAERRGLAADTVILRRMYRGLDTEPIQVMNVISGNTRQSIHQPQICMTGQGHSIVDDFVIQVPNAHGDVPLRVLEMEKTVGTSKFLSAFAYCYVGPGHIVTSQPDMLFWSARERLLENKFTRWGYVSFATARLPHSREYVDRIRSLAAEILPVVIRNN
jgi:hypothetical protein